MDSQQKPEAGKIRITLVRSTIGRPKDQINSVKSLGLRKTNSSVVRNDEPGIRGIVNKISHLVAVEDVAAE